METLFISPWKRFCQKISIYLKNPEKKSYEQKRKLPCESNRFTFRRGQQADSRLFCSPTFFCFITFSIEWKCFFSLALLDFICIIFTRKWCEYGLCKMFKMLALKNVFQNSLNIGKKASKNSILSLLFKRHFGWGMRWMRFGENIQIIILMENWN